MMNLRGIFTSRRGLAITGAACLHAAMLSALMTWRPAPLPPSPVTIPIILVELPPLAQEEAPIPALQPEPPEEAQEDDALQEPETTRDFVPEPEPLRDVPEEQPDAAEQRLSQRLAERAVENATIAEPAPPSGVSLAQGNEAENRAETTAGQDMPPQFVYQFDPFAETAPTVLARVSRAVNCSRVNRDTRPAFCPNYDEDDVFAAAFAQNRPSGWEQASYDPVLDIAAARSALDNFSAAQAKPQFTGQSESFARTHPHDQGLPDKGCRHISYGFSDPFALDKNAAVPDNRTVICDQLK